MKKIIFTVLIIATITCIEFFSFPKAYADHNPNIQIVQIPDPVCLDSGSYKLTFNALNNSLFAISDYTLGLWKYKENSEGLSANPIQYPYRSTNGNIIELKPEQGRDKITIQNQTAKTGKWHWKLWLGRGTPNLKEDRIIDYGDFKMYPKEACNIRTDEIGSTIGPLVGLPILEMLSPVQISSTVNIQVRNINPDSDYLLWFIHGQEFNNGKFTDNENAFVEDDDVINEDEYTEYVKTEGPLRGRKTALLTVTLDNNPGIKTLCLKHGTRNIFGFGRDNCEVSVPIEVTLLTPQTTPILIQSSRPGAPLEESQLHSVDYSIMPEYIDPYYDTSKGIGTCHDLKDAKCFIRTALGSVSTDPSNFIRWLFSIILGLAGGVALILIMIAGYKFMISQGNPEKMADAREHLTSAIVGLLFIIFSFVILQVIGVDLLKIPGFAP